MSFFNQYSGMRLSSNDLQVLLSMLQGSLENRIRWWGNAAHTQEGRNRYMPIVDFYAVCSRQLPQLIGIWAASAKGHTVSEFISAVNQEMSNYLKKYVDNQSDLYVRAALADNLRKNCGGPALMGRLSETVLDKDTDQGYQRTVCQLQFAKQPFSGVEALGGYPITREDVRLLYCSFSNSLVRQIAYLEKQKDNPCRQEQLNRGKTYLDTQLRIADCAWQRAAHLKQKMQCGQNITFGDLYQALSTFNAEGRPNEPGAGKLCGAEAGVVQAGLRGVAPAVAPKAIINTLDIIAHRMNQIRACQDRNLQKTWAIQLAAFAESMVVSMQAFEDGNKRSARMLKDMVLMSFDLPPCMPECSSVVSPTIGVLSADFGKRALAALGSVQRCNETLKKMKMMRLPLFYPNLLGLDRSMLQQIPIGYALHFPVVQQVFTGYITQKVPLNQPFMRFVAY